MALSTTSFAYPFLRPFFAFLGVGGWKGKSCVELTIGYMFSPCCVAFSGWATLVSRKKKFFHLDRLEPLK